jgi:hypothetical protein
MGRFIVFDVNGATEECVEILALPVFEVQRYDHHKPLQKQKKPFLEGKTTSAPAPTRSPVQAFPGMLFDFAGMRTRREGYKDVHVSLGTRARPQVDDNTLM